MWNGTLNEKAIWTTMYALSEMTLLHFLYCINNYTATSLGFLCEHILMYSDIFLAPRIPWAFPISTNIVFSFCLSIVAFVLIGAISTRILPSALASLLQCCLGDYSCDITVYSSCFCRCPCFAVIFPRPDLVYCFWSDHSQVPFGCVWIRKHQILHVLWISASFLLPFLNCPPPLFGGL